MRVTETDGLTLVQYFASAGAVRVEASLVWEGHDIPVPGAETFTVLDNPDYRTRRMFTEWTEYATIGIAILFSIATAMGTQYDSTFGSIAQYLGLFVWAAGAGTTKRPDRINARTATPVMGNTTPCISVFRIVTELPLTSREPANAAMTC
jgi:hypothetical protein